MAAAILFMLVVDRGRCSIHHEHLIIFPTEHFLFLLLYRCCRGGVASYQQPVITLYFPLKTVTHDIIALYYRF